MSAVMTWEDLEQELEVMFPGTSRKVAADKLAEVMTNFTARTIQAYVYGHRNIVSKFQNEFVQVLEAQAPSRAESLKKRFMERPALVQEEASNTRVTKLQMAIDKMCISCAGDKPEEGGFCWDRTCPLAPYTKMPLRSEVDDSEDF